MKIENTLKKLDKSYFDFLQVAEKLVLTKRVHTHARGVVRVRPRWGFPHKKIERELKLESKKNEQGARRKKAKSSV